jgi:hypothetical protein
VANCKVVCDISFGWSISPEDQAFTAIGLKPQALTAPADQLITTRTLSIGKLSKSGTKLETMRGLQGTKKGNCARG